MKGKMYSNIKVEGNGDWGDEKVKEWESVIIKKKIKH